MKSSTRQPKLGIFRKGKSSAQGRPIPDITDFHDESMASSIKRRESIKPNIVMEDLSHEPPSISKFFSKRPAAQAIHTTTSGGSALSHLHQHATTIHQQDRPTRETPHSTATPVLSSNNQARKGSHSPAAAAADVPYYEALSNNSFDSIYRLLDECHDMNQYQTPTSGHRHAKPSYSPVKTPHSFFQPTTTEEQQHAKINTSNMSFLNNSKLPHPLYLHRSATPRVEPTTTTTTMFASPPPCHYNDALYGAPTHQQPTTMMRKPTLLPALTDQRFSAPSWQVAESVASVAANTAAEEHAQLLQQEKAEEEDDDHTTTANNDLELVLQSQAMNMLDDSIRQNDDDIRGFWLRQPGFTTRDQYNKTC
ncbi:hypothetical protein FB192DRAFT_1397469 [Mucor lusitanicus]|nr:hypothetical protein FB192DRAFT_1397469 [Mucor lusitanicus]